MVVTWILKGIAVSKEWTRTVNLLYNCPVKVTRVTNIHRCKAKPENNSGMDL